MKYIAKAVRKALPNLHPKEITKTSEINEEVAELRSRYPHLQISALDGLKDAEYADSAEIILLVDASGSMDKYQKETAARIMELVTRTLDLKYNSLNTKYISFHTQAKRHTSLSALVRDGETGGTLVSRGLDFIHEGVGISANRDTYVLLITDGDNWADDTPECSAIISRLFKHGQIQNFTYIELGGRNPQSLGKAMAAHPYVDAYFEHDLKKTILAN